MKTIRSRIRPVVGLTLGLLLVAPGAATAAPATPDPGAWPALASVIGPIIDEAAASGVEVGVAVSDLSGHYGDASLYLGKQDSFTTASTIKLSLAGTVMNQVERGILALDDVVTITEEERVGGSGSLKDNPFPQEVSIETMLRLMITISDNTATNKLVDVVGGFDAINHLTESAGIAAEDLHFGRKMFGEIVPPDGDIWLTPYGVDQLLRLYYDIAVGGVTEPAFVSQESAAYIIGLMRDQEVKTKLGAVIPAEVIAHKTGENDTVSHDVSLVLVPGQEITLSVFTTAGDGLALPIQEVADPFVQRIGAAVYAYLLETAPAEPAPTDEPTGPGPTPTDPSTPTDEPTESVPSPTAEPGPTDGRGEPVEPAPGVTTPPAPELAATGAGDAGVLAAIAMVLLLGGVAASAAQPTPARRGAARVQ